MYIYIHIHIHIYTHIYICIYLYINIKSHIKNHIKNYMSSTAFCSPYRMCILKVLQDGVTGVTESWSMTSRTSMNRKTALLLFILWTTKIVHHLIYFYILICFSIFLYRFSIFLMFCIYYIYLHIIITMYCQFYIINRIYKKHIWCISNNTFKYIFISLHNKVPLIKGY